MFRKKIRHYILLIKKNQNLEIMEVIFEKRRRKEGKFIVVVDDDGGGGEVVVRWPCMVDKWKNNEVKGVERW